jgi:hypothetical protein
VAAIFNFKMAAIGAIEQNGTLVPKMYHKIKQDP